MGDPVSVLSGALTAQMLNRLAHSFSCLFRLPNLFIAGGIDVLRGI